MVKGLIGQKIGMTRVFDDSGSHVPVTVLKAGPCVVLQVKNKDNDGYNAVQIGLLDETVKERRQSKALLGHLKKAGGPSVRVIREFEFEGEDEVTPGDELTIEQFADVDQVDVTATSKGRGFQGVMRRHGFGGGKATHGSMFHRAPGSVGMAAYPGKVLKGRRMPGQMGNKRATEIGLRVVEIDPDENLLLVAGSVPGSKKGYVFIRPTIKG
jgi:large subunit ribosomal protein L3|tara:strand:+ start:71 stop:706 length:636 start_codon:yes stop_codon:yes gene_type:complete